MIKTTQETVDDLFAARSNKIWHALARRAFSCHKSSPMFRHALSFLLSSCAALSASTAAAQFQYVQYRGMAPGWPNQQASNFTAYSAPQYGQPMYYVARPTTAAYANPAYFGGYNVARAAAQQPPTAAYYAPQATAANYSAAPVQYAPAQYAPTHYAATNAYSVSPAGSSTAGAEAHSYYGQPTAVNYVPPRFTYRTTMTQVPVYMYRPVTVYQPVTGQPVTCLQPATTTQCAPQRTRAHSWFGHSLFNWGHSSCASGACGPQPTTAYCASGNCAPAVATTCNSGQCGQPYYPAQPGVVIPAIPAQPAVVPGTTAPGTIITPLPPAGPTIPSPPTRFGPPASGGVISPADTRPSLSPGAFGPRTTVPSTTVPSTTVPSTTVPFNTPGSFPVNPSTSPGGVITPAPATPFNPGTGSFGTGSGYAPATDPYSNSSTSTSTQVGPIRGPEIRGPELGGPQLRGQEPRADAPARSIQEPKLPTLAPGVQTVPDPDALQPARPNNRAPQLLDPRDKTAGVGIPAHKPLRADQRWAVVPAVWPKPEAAVIAPPANSPYRTYETRSYSPAAHASAYDDSGWTSAR
jgi:hypothetical protein